MSRITCAAHQIQPVPYTNIGRQGWSYRGRTNDGRIIVEHAESGRWAVGSYSSGAVCAAAPFTSPSRLWAEKLPAEVRHEVRSSWIAAIRYASIGGGRGVLTVELATGAEYVYGEAANEAGVRGVPSWLVGLMLSGSAGKAYGRLVKYNGYSVRKVEAPDPPEVDLIPLLRASLVAAGAAV